MIDHPLRYSVNLEPLIPKNREAFPRTTCAASHLLYVPETSLYNHLPTMPNYDYVCDTCHQQFEVFQSMKDPHLTKCMDESCTGAVKRKLGVGAGFVFKGSGFYITDYRSDSYKAAAKSDSSASSSSSSESSSAAKESKPAAAAAPAATTPSSS
jgi:putative FmdB family regulatory protein